MTLFLSCQYSFVYSCYLLSLFLQKEKLKAQKNHGLKVKHQHQIQSDSWTTCVWIMLVHLNVDFFLQYSTASLFYFPYDCLNIFFYLADCKNTVYL